MRRGFLKLVALGCVAVAIVGCWGGNSWHQKLTVTVQTPRGLVSGASVTEVSHVFREDWAGITLGDRVRYNGKLRGEAVAVDLGGGKYLFALLDERQERLAFEAFYPKSSAPKELETSDPILFAHFGHPTKVHANEIEASRKSIVLPEKLYPLLVTFADLQNSASVKAVKPGELSDAFGAGYALESITFEISDEPITSSTLSALLPWLSELTGALIPTPLKRATEYRIEETLSASNFRIGV